MSQANRARGRWGERVAADRYRADGYEILARNWRCAEGELDLVARLGDVVAVIEVKSRRTDAYGSPLLAVGVQKQRRIRTLALRWREAEMPTERVTFRFDVVAVTGTTVEVVQGAF